MAEVNKTIHHYVEKMKEYLLEEYPELFTDYPKPLDDKKIGTLIMRYGYDNSLLYLEKFANYTTSDGRYKSPFATANSWLDADVKDGKIIIPQVKAEVKREQSRQVIWTTDETHRACELFRADYPPDSAIRVNNKVYFMLTGGRIEASDGEIIGVSNFIFKHFHSYLYKAREALENEKNADYDKIVEKMKEAREVKKQTTAEFLAKEMAKLEQKFNKNLK